MPIGKKILDMSNEALNMFVSARRTARARHEWTIGPKGKKKDVTVAQISKALGISKAEVIKRLEETLKKP